VFISIKFVYIVQIFKNKTEQETLELPPFTPQKCYFVGTPLRSGWQKTWDDRTDDRAIT